MLGDDGCDHSRMSRPKLPQVQVGDPVTADLEPAAHAIGKPTARNNVEQHRAR